MDGNRARKESPWLDVYKRQAQHRAVGDIVTQCSAQAVARQRLQARRVRNLHRPARQFHQPFVLHVPQHPRHHFARAAQVFGNHLMGDGERVGLFQRCLLYTSIRLAAVNSAVHRLYNRAIISQHLPLGFIHCLLQNSCTAIPSIYLFGR